VLKGREQAELTAGRGTFLSMGRLSVCCHLQDQEERTWWEMRVFKKSKIIIISFALDASILLKLSIHVYYWFLFKQN